MSRLFERALALALLLGLAPVAAFAQDPPLQAGQQPGAEPERQVPEVKPEEIDAGLQALAALTDLSDEARKAAESAWTEARAAVQAAQAAREEAQRFEQQLADAPRLRDEYNAQLSQTPPEPKPEVPPQATLKDVERLRDAAAAEATAAAQEADTLKLEAERRTQRQTALPEQIVAARDKLAAARQGLDATAPPGESEPGRAAREARARARYHAAAADLRRLQAEQAAYQARQDVLQLRRDLAKRNGAQTAKLLAAWEQVASEFRRRAASDSEAEVRELRRRAEGYPELREAAAEVQRLTELLNADGGVNDRIDAVTAANKQRRDRLASLRSSFDKARRQFRVAGGTYKMGLLLRVEYEKLPEEHQLAREIGRRREDISDAAYQVVVLQIQRDEVGDVGARVQAFLESQSAELDAAQRAQLEADARVLFTAERERLAEALDRYRTYADRLDELVAATAELQTATREFRAFIEERILWVRSVREDQLFDFASAGEAGLWLAGLSPASEGVERLPSRARESAGWLVAGGLAVGLLLLLGRRSRARLEALAERTVSYRTDNFRLTLAAMLQTLVLAAPLPVAFGALELAARSLEAPSPWEQAWSGALGGFFWIVLPVYFFRSAMRAGGLAETHFRWPKETTRGLRNELRWFLPLAIPLYLLSRVLASPSTQDYSDSLGRVFFCVAVTALGLLLYRWLRPTGPVLSTYLKRNPRSPIAKGRYLWVGLGVGFPLALLVLAVAGYHYSAQRLERAAADSLVLVSIVIVLFNLGLRALFIARRRLAVEQALKRRAQQLEAQKQEGPASEPTREFEDKIDIPAVDAQSRKLMRTGVLVALVIGLLQIWSPIVPSLQYFDRVQVWPRLAMLTPEEELSSSAVPVQAAPPAQKTGDKPTANGGGEAKPAAGPSMPVPMPSSGGGASADGEGVSAALGSITLADVGLALIFALLTVLGARNVPGLLEITVLKRLPLDAGSRYAVTTIARYLIVLFGGTLAFGAVHVGWDTVKWLAAALTFGLAFGLQEIFANFISGLILLLERPIRVGDTVTVGTVEGKVSRIRMRATTVVDWDNRELLVPNKNLITSEVINWTLSDPVTRVVFKVGVAYGSDVRKVKELLLRAARECPHTVADPAPTVWFKSFGDSALIFDLRGYIPERPVWLDTMNDVQTRIDDLFREHGIVIAFPQLDVHMVQG